MLYSMAAALNALRTAMGRLGFIPDAAEALTNPAQQGISDMTTMLTLEDNDCTQISNAIRRPLDNVYHSERERVVMEDDLDHQVEVVEEGVHFDGVQGPKLLLELWPLSLLTYSKSSVCIIG